MIRTKLQDELGCYVMTFNSAAAIKTIPVGRRLSDMVKAASLTSSQKQQLRDAEDELQTLGVSLVAYAKPLEVVRPEDSSKYWSSERVLVFFKTHMTAVISTSYPQEPMPESAVVAFAEDEELCLYFQTRTYTRKFRNLRVNPKAAFVIGFDMSEDITVQYEGIVTRLTTELDMEVCKQLLMAKGSHVNPEYLKHPEAALFKVTPIWIRYSNYSDHNPGVSQMSFSR